MKTGTIVLIILIVGAVAYKLGDRKEPVKIEVKVPVAVVQAPPSPPPPAIPLEPVAPDLSRVGIFGRKYITNATVFNVNSGGITFKCDQGLVKVSFDDLTPDFYAYYSSQIKDEPSLPPPPQPHNANPAMTVTRQTLDNISYRDPRIERAAKRANLQRRMDSLKSTIDAYSRQNSFTNKPGMYRINRDDFERARLELEQLQSEYQNLLD